MSTELTNEPLSDTGGIVVRGISLDGQLDDEVRDELRRLYVDHGLVLLRGQRLDPEQHIRFSRVFGDLDIHPVEQMRLEGYPEIIELSNRGRALGPAGEDEIIGQIPWHSDLTYTVRPSRGAVLYARQVPEEGGETGFIDTAAAYDGLDDATKRRIDDLEMVHSARAVQQSAVVIDGKEAQFSEAMFPDVIHPLVVTHPETGRKALNVSPSCAERIVGLSDKESRSLLDDLIAHATARHFVYIHRWHTDDVVVWDNWRTMHMALGYKAKFLRIMHRTTLSPTYELGRLAS